MKKIALTIDEMKQLKSLGLDTSDASMCWYPDNDPDFPDDPIYGLTSAEQIGINYPGRVPAYTLQDILEKIPNYKIIKSPNEWADSISLEVRFDDSHIHKLITSNSEIECAYQMLLWCIENGHTKTNKI